MSKRTILLTLNVLLLCLVAGCAGAGDAEPGPAAETPVALPRPAEAEATAFVTGGSVTGTALWGVAPAPGATVELRSDEWRMTGDETAVTSAVADAEGRFMLTDVPAGEWSVVALWPDGTLSTGGTPVVTVTEGQGINDVIVRLERPITLLEPDLSQPGNATPTFRWTPIDGIATYRVLLIDMGTAAAVVEGSVTSDSLTVAEGVLEPSRRYTVVISGMDEASGEPLASFTGEYGVLGAEP